MKEKAVLYYIHNLAIKFQQSCSTGLVLNISSLQCGACPTGFFPSTDQLSCITCDGTSGKLFDFQTGVALSQAWTAAALTADSLKCACSKASNPPNFTTIIAQVLYNGTEQQRCVTCPNGTLPDPLGVSCVPIGGSLPGTDTITQLSQALTLLQAGISVQAAIQSSISIPSGSGSGSGSGGYLSLLVPQSQPLVQLLGPAGLACYHSGGADLAACATRWRTSVCCSSTTGEALAACDTPKPSPQPPPTTPDPYAPDPQHSTASCVMYLALVDGFTGTSARRTSTSTKPATGPMPWLYYQGSAYSQDKSMAIRVRFQGGSLASGSVSSLEFVLASYRVNGTFLGYRNWTTQFQICGAAKRDSSLWHRFGWEYANRCSVGLSDVLSELTDTTQPVFYELFLRDSNATLYPVPVRIGNKDITDKNTDSSQGAVRRFFYVDNMLGVSAQTGSLQAVQFPTAFSLNVTLMDSPRNAIYPPYLYIMYGGYQVSSSASSGGSSDPASTPAQAAYFAVNYRNEGALGWKFWHAWQTVLVVFEVALAVPVWFWRLWQYSNRKRMGDADQMLIVHGAIMGIDIGSFTLCLALLVVSVYYMIIYKLQQEIYFLMIPDDQVQNFTISVVLAVVGQAVALVNMLWHQANVDILFIDWERPRRVIQPPWLVHPLQVLILVGGNLMSAGNITPNGNDLGVYTNVQTSIILRFGITSAFLLVIFVAQFLFKKLLYHPYISNPITRLVDLMFLANISALIFDDKSSGFYIHGRNQATHSDATLRALNQELLREEDGLVTHRGLVTDNKLKPALDDSQLFLVHLTEGSQEDAGEEARQRKGYVGSFLRGQGRAREEPLRANDEIADMFKGIIDDAERNHATQVVDPTYIQSVLQMRPVAAASHCVFVHDYHESFSSTVFLGHEVRLYVFEAIVLLAIDMSLKSITVSALLTYLIIRVVAWVRAQAGESNISGKTLVDRHFFA
ncbi:MAG: hypothetical protein WDW38_005281 [Sanguina aurantia]